VSWNEFLYQMLAKGEVEQIIVRPDIDIVTIILHEGAIIKGRRVRVLHHIIYRYIKCTFFQFRQTYALTT